MKILDGKLVSSTILSDIKSEIETRQQEEHLGLRLKIPSMAVVMVGDNPASETYVKFKLRAAEKAGIEAHLIKFPETVTQFELVKEIWKLNQSHFNGYIVQLPLPSHIDKEAIIANIDPDKDIDGFTPINFGKSAIGLKDSIKPATPYGILKLLEYYDIETLGKHVVVIGRSDIVGKPISILLGNDFKIGRSTVTSCDINTPKELLREETKRADIVIVAAGCPNLLTGDMVKEGVIVIDVGINRLDNGKLVGDVDYEEVSKKASYITPVPGGVGPMTIGALMLNVMQCWKRKNFIHD